MEPGGRVGGLRGGRRRQLQRGDHGTGHGTGDGTSHGAITGESRHESRHESRRSNGAGNGERVGGGAATEPVDAGGGGRWAPPGAPVTALRRVAVTWSESRRKSRRAQGGPRGLGYVIRVTMEEPGLWHMYIYYDIIYTIR